MSTLTRPVVGYVGAVLGVISIASFAVFNLQAMAAKGQRHWDADIDRIIARQQAKKHGMIALARAETPGVQNDAGPQFAALTTEPLEEDNDEAAVSAVSAVSNDGIGPQKVQSQVGKKSTRRPERRQQHYIPAAFATLPKFATTAAMITTTISTTRLRPR
jgi:hypothetical protein